MIGCSREGSQHVINATINLNEDGWMFERRVTACDQSNYKFERR